MNWWDNRSEMEKGLIIAAACVAVVLIIGLRLTISCTRDYCWLAFSIPNPFGG